MFTQFQNYVQKNVGTTSATLITCPAGQQLVVNQLSCANITAFPVTVSVTVTRSGNEVYLVRSATVNPGGSLGCAGIDQKIVLMAGDQIKVQSNTASSIDAIASGVLNDFNASAAIPNVPTSPVATFSITPNTTTIYEGATVTYTVATTNVPNGTVLYWDNFGTTNNYDYTDGMNYGPVVINSNAGSFTRTLVSSDVVGEGSETIVMGLRFGPPPLGGVMAVASTVTVQDSIITSGLIMHLDAGNTASYPGSGVTWTDISGSGNNVTLQNSPTYSNGALTFNGTNQWARTTANLNLTTYDSITVEMLVRSTNPTVSQMAWEHTANWNTNVGGLGLSIHSNGTGVLLNVHHTNHNTSVARNYEATVGTNWAVHTNVYSRIGDSLGRLTYVNGQYVSFSIINGYATTTVTPAGASFANDVLYFASRGGTSAYMPGQIARFRIYNRKLSATEISQNFNATTFPA